MRMHLPCRWARCNAANQVVSMSCAGGAEQKGLGLARLQQRPHAVIPGVGRLAVRGQLAQQRRGDLRAVAHVLGQHARVAPAQVAALVLLRKRAVLAVAVRLRARFGRRERPRRSMPSELFRWLPSCFPANARCLPSRPVCAKSELPGAFRACPLCCASMRCNPLQSACAKLYLPAVWRDMPKGRGT